MLQLMRSNYRLIRGPHLYGPVLFLWLVTLLSVLTTDKLDEQHIVATYLAIPIAFLATVTRLLSIELSGTFWEVFSTFPARSSKVLAAKYMVGFLVPLFAALIAFLLTFLTGGDRHDIMFWFFESVLVGFTISTAGGMVSLLGGGYEQGLMAGLVILAIVMKLNMSDQVYFLMAILTSTVCVTVSFIKHRSREV